MAVLEHWIVAVGASGAQGVRDVRALLAALPPTFPGTVLAVLHRPTDRVSHLQEVLAMVSQIPVLIARDGESPRAGACYVGEPNAHLALGATHRFRLVPDDHNAYRNRTIDLLFNSLAAASPPRMIGLVLSGSLDDGARGLAAMHAAGGRVLVLTPHDPGGEMPANAMRYDGPVDYVGDVADIAREICRIVYSDRRSSEPAGAPA